MCGPQRSLSCSLPRRAVKETITRATMNLIRSELHKMYSITCNKLALSSFDDKRYVLDDKVNTRAHGHYLNRLEAIEW